MVEEFYWFRQISLPRASSTFLIYEWIFRSPKFMLSPITEFGLIFKTFYRNIIGVFALYDWRSICVSLCCKAVPWPWKMSIIKCRISKIMTILFFIWHCPGNKTFPPLSVVSNGRSTKYGDLNLEWNVSKVHYYIRVLNHWATGMTRSFLTWSQSNCDFPNKMLQKCFHFV